MRRILAVMPILLFNLSMLFVSNVVAAKEADKADVRVLIDISGSMKQNDPQNLRRPALRMLVGLMQPGTEASVWTFAKWSNELVPHSKVDKAWKKKALALSKKISSPGQFTNIEEILKNATKDWKAPSSSHVRHIVLLTDGVVDVSKKSGESEASRQRIVEELLPEIQKIDAKVHAIALSENADHDLLKMLAGETGGWYEKIDKADQLQRVFLRIFEKVGQPDSVPLKANKFTVDSSINEATILLFKKEGSPDTVLISPNGEEFTDTNLPAGIAWYRDDGYELLTISAPEKGEWSLRADIDPDNRVMVVTDLKLVASAMPSHLVVGETIPVSANLTSRGKIVKRKAFLRLLDVRADALSPAGSDPQLLNDLGEHGDKAANDGLYSMSYSEAQAYESVELLVSVESATFMREKRHRLAVHNPAELAFSTENDKTSIAVNVSEAAMQGDSKVQAWQQKKGEERQTLELVNSANNPYVWSSDITNLETPVYFSVEGPSKQGNFIQEQYGPVYAPGHEPKPEPAPEPVAVESPPDEEETPKEETEEVDEEDELTQMLMFGGLNVLVVLIGFGVWWFLKKRKKADEVVLVEDDVDDDDDEEGDLGEDIQQEADEASDEEGDKA